MATPNNNKPSTPSSGSNDPKHPANGQGVDPSVDTGAEDKKGGSSGKDDDVGLQRKAERKVADMAMNATPGLSQANSARHALKEANAAKRKAGGKEGMSDKVEEVADDVVDKGIDTSKTGLKMMIAGQIASKGAMVGAMVGGMMALKYMLGLVKAFVVNALSKIFGAVAAFFQGAASMISGFFGVGAAAGKFILSVMLGLTTVGAGYGVSEVASVAVQKKDTGDNLECIPTATSVPSGSQDYVEGEGGIDVAHEEHAIKIWSVFSKMGASESQTAAVLGNMHYESSGLDPTAVETIYDEPFRVGPRKEKAEKVNFRVGQIDAGYAARFPAIQFVGIGLAQWTNERNTMLVDYAKKNNIPWNELDTQIRFIFDGDHSYRVKQINDFLTAPTTNVVQETEKFMNTWIGLSTWTGPGGQSLPFRQKMAKEYEFIIKGAKVDNDYADSILSGINVSQSQVNKSVSEYYQDDGCGSTVASHYAGKELDGTGEVPQDLTTHLWGPDNLPESLKKFTVDPKLSGLSYGTSEGWASNIIPGQCVALSVSYFMRIYPDWDKNGRSTQRPLGNGKDQSFNWAKHYGGKVSKVPSEGAVFSDPSTSVYGHTGIVQHVFANGDIIFVEENVPGLSGDLNGQAYSWSYRIARKEQYEAVGYTFFKPDDAEPQWDAGSPGSASGKQSSKKGKDKDKK